MRRIAVPVIIASALALGAGLLVGAPASAVVPPAAEPATAVVAGASAAVKPAATRVPRLDVGGLAKAALGAAKAIYKCTLSAKDGVKCEKRPTIGDVVKRLDALEAQIARNQDQTLKAIAALQVAQEGAALSTAVANLKPIESHIFEAALAWDALSLCAEKAETPGATCKAYNGAAGPTEPMPVAEGMAVSQDYFLRQMDKVTPMSIEKATEFFAGTKMISGIDGLLHALWRSANGQQGRDSRPDGAPTIIVPWIVTHSLSVDFVPALTYYRDMVFLYGALLPAAYELRQKPTAAESEANLADKNIFARTDRWTVAGAFDYYRIPDVPKGSLAYVGQDGRLYKIVEGEGKGMRLTAGVVQEIGDRLAKSGYDADLMRKNPDLLPHGGRFGVLEKVKKRNHVMYANKFAICASEEGVRGCDPKRDGTAVETFEIGHPGAVGSRDEYGNVLKERWVPMRILSKPAKWSSLVEQAKSDRSGPCVLRGEPPNRVFGVQFLSTFRRMVEGRHADYEWMTVRYDYRSSSYVTLRCVGPGVYVSETRGEPFSIKDKGWPAGILVK